MWNLFKRLYKLLTRREKVLAAIVVTLFGITSIMEVIGLGVIFLYVKLILDPAQISQIPILSTAKEILAPNDQRQFLVLIGIGLLGIFMLKTIFGIASLWLSGRFTVGRLKMFSIDLYRIYLFKNYDYFLDQNMATLKKNILDDVFTTVSSVISPLLIIISEIMVLGFIVGFLLFLHPVETIIMFASTAVIFGLYAVCVNGFIENLGQRKQQANTERHGLVSDTFHTIKEIIVWNARQPFLSHFKDVMSRYSRATAQHEILVKAPRYCIEAIGLFLITGLIIHGVKTLDNPASVISIVALYGAAGMRMLPSFNRIISSAGTIRFNRRSLMSFYNDLLLRRFLPKMSAELFTSPTPITFEKTIEFSDISFAYSEGGPRVIQNLSLTINKYSSIAFVGSSGAGKSTIIEMLLGLVEPVEGKIYIDDVYLDSNNIDAWRGHIGYIPQRVSLLDCTVAENIAFGVQSKNIDMERVREACKMARIHELIERDLVDGYQTRLGDRGVRLSGGQAQRIAIARALYRQPSVLIMDEATAALDGITEYEITETLSTLTKKLTIILIAHRLNTVKYCDRIYLLDKGKIADAGTYSELLERNDTFQKMAR